MAEMIVKFVLMIYFSIKFSIKNVLSSINIKATNYDTCLLVLPGILLTLVSLGPVVLLLAICWIYKQLVNVILRLKLGNDYICLITGCNLMTCLHESKEPATVSVLLIVKSEEDGEHIYDSIKDRIKGTIEDPQYQQLFTIREKFMDYAYLKRANFQPEQIVKKFKAKNEGELMAFMNKFNLSGLPKDNRGNFDVAFGTKKLDGKAGYPLVIRVHHCLTDGLSFYNIIRKIFCQSSLANDAYANDLSKRVQNNKNGNNFKQLLKNNLNTLTPSTLPLDVFRNSSDEESEIILSYLLEPEVKYVPVVKRIKQRIPNLAFNAIVLAAFSASVAEYCTKKFKPDEIPEYITAATPFQLKRERFEMAYSSKRAENFQNDFTISYYNLPVVPKSKKGVPIDDYAVDTLLYLKDEFQRIFKSPELIVNYVCMKIFVGVAPYSIIRKIFSYGTITTSVSCIPGGPKLHLFQGDAINDIVFFTPKQANMSIALCALTYDNRIQLSLKGSKTRIPEPAELESILRGTFRFLDVLDEKTKALYGN